MKKRLLLLINALILFISTLVFAQDYIVGEGDVLRVTVYDHDDLTTVARVSGDGVIAFPQIGQINVNVHTPWQTYLQILGALLS